MPRPDAGCDFVGVPNSVKFLTVAVCFLRLELRDVESAAQGLKHIPLQMTAVNQIQRTLRPEM